MFLKNNRHHAYFKRFLKVFLLVLCCCAIIGILQPLYMLSKAAFAQILLERAWHSTKMINFNEKKAPWAWADAYPVAKITYLNMNQNEESSWIILAGMTGRNMAFAPSWLQDSAKPNDYGNTVISAHNDSHFSVLEHVKLGDVFTVESSDKRLINYRVSDISIVDETDNSAYEFSDDTLLTLITCYPFTLNTNSSDKTQRQIVKARAVYHSL